MYICRSAGLWSTLLFPPVLNSKTLPTQTRVRDTSRTKTRTTSTSRGTTLEWRHTDKRWWGTSTTQSKVQELYLVSSQASIDDARMNEPQIKLYFEIWFC